MAEFDARDNGGYGDHDAFKPAERAGLIERAVPVSACIPSYRPPTFRRDALAGATVAALAIPAGMAYAELAGLKPVAGLYALLLPTVAYALLGSSRQLIVGPEGSLSALVAAAVLGLAAAGSSGAAELAAVLALMVAACFVLARVARLGWIADYLSRPVLIGYIHGVAGVLIVGQLGKVLGLDIKASDPLPQLAEVAREIADTNPATIAVGGVSLVILLLLRFFAPRIPAALLVVVGAIVASVAIDLASHGVDVVGSIPPGLPSLSFPTPPLDDALTLIPAAVGLFLVSFADAILTARSFAGNHGQHIDVSQELLALGAASVAAGVSQGLPVGASGSRTAVNDAMGARSQIAGLLAAGAVALVLLFLTGPIAHLPKAVLGAVIIGAAIGLIDAASWRGLWRTDRMELTIAAVTTVGVLVTGVLEAILFAVGLSIVDVVRRSARPHDAVLGWVEQLGRYADVSVHKTAEVTPGVVVYRLDDRLFFANASYVKGRVREALHAAPTSTRWVIFDAEGVGHVDVAGAAALTDLADSLDAEDIGLAFARLKEPMRRRFAETGVTERIGSDHFHATVRAAIDAYEITVPAERQLATRPRS